MRSDLRLDGPPPGLLDANGAPRFGAWAGRLDAIDWSGLRQPRAPGWLERRLRHKRWQFMALSHDTVCVGLAVVDLGWAAHGFLYAFERDRQRLTSIARDGLPRAAQVSPTPFAEARLRLRGLSLSLYREGAALRVSARGRTVRLEATLDLGAMPPPACIVAPGNLLAHATHKSGAIPASAVLRIADRTVRIEHGWASLDHSDGLLARDTAWHWASAHAGQVGFNLQAGYMGAAENVVWLDGVPNRIGAVRFERRGERDWHVASECGSTDFVFTGEAAYCGDRKLIVAAAQFEQGIGHFSGRLGVPGGPLRFVQNLSGLVEQHRARW